VRSLQPAIRPLFTSVHDGPHELPLELAAGGAMVLAKPFSPEDLRKALRNRMGT
jgi:CheY-like chemotaxis protein